jgi:serine/threonine protein kinase
MGVVWAGRDEVLARAVAIKEVTPPTGLTDEQRVHLRERTLREARAAARINSRAAVTVYDVVEEDGRPWIVMELLPPRTLADVLREEGPLPEEAAARVGLRVLDALSAAHGAGVLHRDVKPANVLYDSTGQAVLTDFGIASLDGDPSMTTTGTIIGSPGYVAPERALGQPPSPASDLWSLGVLLATAVHGRSPFERDSPLATLGQRGAARRGAGRPARQGPQGPARPGDGAGAARTLGHLVGSCNDTHDAGCRRCGTHAGPVAAGAARVRFSRSSRCSARLPAGSAGWRPTPGAPARRRGTAGHR